MASAGITKLTPILQPSDFPLSGQLYPSPGIDVTGAPGLLIENWSATPLLTVGPGMTILGVAPPWGRLTVSVGALTTVWVTPLNMGQSLPAPPNQYVYAARVANAPERPVVEQNRWEYDEVTIAPNQGVQAYMFVQNGPNVTPITSTLNLDSDNGSNILGVGVGQYNPSSGVLRRLTTNFPATVLASTTATATLATANQTNINARGMILSVNVTAVSGTSPTLTPVIESIDPVSGSAYALATPAAITAVGLYTYALYPGASGGSVTAAYSLPLPDTWLVNAVIGGTTPSFTFSIGARYIL